MTSDLFIARQPIFDGDRRTFGYELLYRAGPDSLAAIDDPDAATKEVMQRAVLDWGMERIIGEHFGFINASPQLIASGLHRSLPPEGIIIELREDETPDGNVLDALAMARREGYHFALDNVSSLEQLRSSRLLPLTSMVKVEAHLLGQDDFGRIAEWVRSERPGTLLIAEKIEQSNQCSAAVEAGYDLFEGHYFARPEILRRAARPSSMTSTLSLMAEMQRDDIDINRVEELVGTDPTLAYRILAVVNSSAFGLDRRVESLRHAIVLLGVGQVRRLATLIAMSASGESSEELVAAAAIRARVASEVTSNPELKSGAFTVGLLSLTDALYQTPMEELVDELPVSASIREALIDGTGPFGTALAIARACERADIEQLMELAPEQVASVQNIYADAVNWADGIRGQLGGRRSKVRLPQEMRAPSGVHGVAV